MQLERRAIGRFGQPDVQVFALARLEEEDVVAVVEVGELVELGQLGLGVEFGVFAGVGEEGVQVSEEVAMTEDSLLAKGLDVAGVVRTHRYVTPLLVNMRTFCLFRLFGAAPSPFCGPFAFCFEIDLYTDAMTLAHCWIPVLECELRPLE